MKDQKVAKGVARELHADEAMARVMLELSSQLSLRENYQLLNSSRSI